MQTSFTKEKINQAIALVAEASKEDTGGKWLEELVEQIGPHIADWDIAGAYAWDQWPEREVHFPKTTKQDIGIDVVAVRRSDGEYIAIQCKARKLDQNARGADITKTEIDKFGNTSAGPSWSERWLVTNGDVRPSGNILQTISMHNRHITLVNIAADLAQEQTKNNSKGLTQDPASDTPEDCPHCKLNLEDDNNTQTKDCMQIEAIDKSVQLLREHELTDSGGLPRGHPEEG